MQLTNKRCLVTGGCGFIGSHIVERLAIDGNEVHIIDNLVTGKLENIQNLEGNISFHEVSVTEKNDKYFKDIDIIFHLAANISVTGSVEDPIYDAKTNIMGMLNVLEAARKHDVPQFVYSSSSAVYGDDVKVPTDESQPTVPSSPYGLSKLSGEIYLRLYSNLYGLNSVSLRYFNVYGPRQADDSPYSGVIALFIRAAVDEKPLLIFGDGSQTRDFVYISDVVDVNINAAAKKGMKGEPYNIGTGNSTSINQLVEVIESLSGREERIYEPARKGDIKESTAVIKLAEDALNFEPEVTLEAGLKKLYDASI